MCACARPSRMQAAKAHLLVVIVLVQIVALYDGQVPYYPTEISRTVASSDSAGAIFKAGVLTLPLTLWLSGSAHLQSFGVWAALMIIACYDDVDSWGLHMAGVGLLGAVAVCNTWTKGIDAALPLCAAFLLFGLRVVFKFLAILLFELPLLKVDWKDQSFLHVLVQTYASCMYNGPLSRSSLPMFKLGGVLQWVVFYLLAQTF